MIVVSQKTGLFALRTLIYAVTRSFLIFTVSLSGVVPAFGQSSTASPSTPQPPTPMSVEGAHELLEHGQELEAIHALLNMALVQPPVPGVSRELGIAYYRTGKLDDAEKSFAAAMTEDPHDAESEQMRGLTLFRLGKPIAAIPYLEHSRQTTTDSNVDANYVLARCYINAQKYVDARGAFAAQYNVDPESGSAYLLMAQMLVSLELPEIAATNAQKALQISPNITMAHFLLGKIYLAKGDSTRALEEFERERRVSPVYPPLYQFLGDLYIRDRQYAQAQHALTEALSLDQTSTGPFILMGKLFLADNDPQTAATYLQHAEQMDPSNYITHYLLGTAYRQTGKKDDAKREFDAVRSLHSGHLPESRELE